MNKLKGIKDFIINKPFLAIAIFIIAIVGLIFLFLGSAGLFLKSIAKRPLFYFGVYIITVMTIPFVYSIYLKTKSKKISGTTFNQIIKDISHTLKTVIVLVFSVYMATYAATQAITVYFSNYNARFNISGTGHTFNFPSGPYGIQDGAEKIVKSQEGKGETETVQKKEFLVVKEKGRVMREQIDTIVRMPTIPAIFLSQEYPSSQEYKYTQSIKLAEGTPAVMDLKDDYQSMWFGIRNIGLSNVGNPTLFLKFTGDFDIKTQPNVSLGWSTMEPNRQFNIRIGANLQPGSGFRLNPLSVRFKEAGTFTGEYTITSDNNLPKSGIFTIKVVK